MSWIPIRYREFYDLPRSFLAERAGAAYFFDCPFDERIDDYPDHYRVYRLASRPAATTDSGSWAALASGASFIGEVPLAAIRFDPTRRAAIDDTIFGLLGAAARADPPPTC